MTLQDCLAAAVHVNPAIQAAQLEPLLAEADYLAAQGLFDPTFFLNYTFSDRVDPLNQRAVRSVRGVVSAVKSRTTAVVGGVGGLGAAGTQYTVSFQSVRTDSTVNAFFGTQGEYQLDLTASVMQPLLRNFGIRTTTTGVRTAALERIAAVTRLDAALIDTLFQVEQAYWELVLAHEQHRVQVNGRELARKLLDETRARLEVGVVAPLAVLEAETALARREEGVLLADQAVGDAMDALWRRLAANVATVPWQDAISPTDAPDVQIVALDAEAAVTAALRDRPELEQLRIGQQQARLQTAFRKNQRLPEWNLVGEYGFRAVRTDFERARRDILHGEDPHWLLGFEVSLPWGNREARGAYARAHHTETQTTLRLRQTEQAVIQDVRAAVRQVRTGLERVETTRIAKRLAQEQLAAEEAKLAVGVSTPFEVRQRQDDLIDAEGTALQALIGYRIALADVARAQGRYLDRIGLHVSVDSRMPGPAPPGDDTSLD